MSRPEAEIDAIREGLRERLQPYTDADGSVGSPATRWWRRRAPEPTASLSAHDLRRRRRPRAARGKTVAIIGYGSQGHAHALNLKDSGVDVVVGLREDSSSVAKAREQGLEVLSRRGGRQPRGPGDDPGARRAPPRRLGERIPRRRRRGQHAAVRSRLLDPLRRGRRRPPGVDVGMVAPKGPGHLVRRQFTEGSGVPGPDRRSSRTPPATPARSRWPTPRGSAAPAAA